MTAETWVILNPRSARGRTGRERRRFEARILAALGPVELVLTRAPMHAAELARRARAAGAARLLVVGGDGTLGEVVNGLVDGAGDRMAGAPAVGLLPHGTGGDFRRTLGLPPALDDQLRVIRAGHRRRIDLGRLRFRDPHGRAATRCFVNTASAGMSGEVCAAVNGMRWTKHLGGGVAFNLASLRALASYPNPPVRLELDDAPAREFRANTIAVCNGRYFGGGMMIAPDACPDDGSFDVVTLGDLRWFDTVRSMPLLYRGTHLAHPKAACTRARRVRITPLEARPLRLEVDGEAPGRAPVELDLLPGALEVIVPERAP